MVLDVFFTTLLAIPQHHIKLAFRMFDENGDGEVDQQEFKRVMNVLRCAHASRLDSPN